MTVAELFEYVDEILENSFSDNIKRRWLNQIEAEIQADVLLLAPDGIVKYGAEDNGAELIAPAPYDELYCEYLFWRICLAQHENELADNYAATFNRLYNEYVRFVCETINPGTGMAEKIRYYLTAYQIAVKHGYAGTEAEWVESLKGPEGKPGAGLHILGHVDAETDLPMDPEQGDGYLVGADNLLYIWDGKGWFYKLPLRGEKGDPGKTPQKGVDYWTQEEAEEMNAAKNAANTAAGNADWAAGVAQTAAVSAGTAAGNANNAASAANTEAENARTAATAAAVAAGNAQTVADEVRQAKESGQFKGDPFTYSDFTADQLEGLRGPAGTVTIAGADKLEAGADPTVTEQEGSTEGKRIYRIGIPKGDPGVAPKATLNTETINVGNVYLVRYTLTIEHPDGTKDSVTWGPGENGRPGGNGGYYFPTVSEEGVLSWSVVSPDSNGVIPTPDNAVIKGKDGRGILSIQRTSGDGSPGTTDTYTITYSDGGTDTIEVYNGKDGEGTGGSAEVTAESIREALGYEPAKQTDVEQIAEDLEERALKTEIPEVPVQSVNKKTGAVSLNAGDVGADPAGTASGAVDTHNVSENAHNDIRLLIEGLTTRLNALANSTDEDLDQMAELVAYIKSNKSLIDGITTSKVNVSDIVNNLTTNVANKPLSAAQGVALKALIDAITVPTKLSELTNDKGYLTGYTETDPTVPAWAKASTKPSYTKSEVGLGNVDNIKQYSASNPPPYPVKSVNGKTGSVTLTANDVQADPSGTASSAVSAHNTDAKAHNDIRQEVNQLSSQKANRDEIPDVPVQSVNGKTGAVELTAADVGATTEEYVDNEIADLKAQGIQQVPEYAESVDWLNENGDQSKVYVLPDGMLYAWMLTTVESGPAYTNILPLAVNADGTEYVGNNGEDGYKTGVRLNSSKAEVTESGMCCTGFVPVTPKGLLRLKNITPTGTKGGYLYAYNSDRTTAAGAYSAIVTALNENYDAATGIYTIDLSNTTYVSAPANAHYIRLSIGNINANTIITCNEEIKEGGTTTGYAWANTGHAFVPADYEGRIVAVESKTTQHSAKIAALEKAVTSGGTDQNEKAALTRIKEWDKPVCDVAPVTLLGEERTKSALTTSDRTVASIYAKYRALMAEHPNYITETNMGKCTASASFAAVDMLRFDFKEPNGLTDANYSAAAVHENKPKIILMSGVHTEWAGVWGLYYALEEIASNPDFDDIRRNAHIIVIPCANPFCLSNQTVSGWATSHVNANGVAIHNNFNVDHSTSGAVGESNYGGSAPCSELETQYIDAVMAENPDAIAFVSCHNNDYSTMFGAPVIWASSATYHMCNVAFRLIDKLSKAWLDKYGDALKNAIDTYKINMAATDYRLGRAMMSSSAGTEQKNATKYGIQATNLEISRMMKVFSGEIDGSSEVMTRGAEVYANFMRTLLWNYDHNDKKDYAPNLPWSD